MMMGKVVKVFLMSHRITNGDGMLDNIFLKKLLSY